LTAIAVLVVVILLLTSLRIRYMPGYELFGQAVTRKDAPWSGKGLQITLNAQREVLNVAKF
jgi:hypothetical protein